MKKMNPWEYADASWDESEVREYKVRIWQKRPIGKNQVQKTKISEKHVETFYGR